MDLLALAIAQGLRVVGVERAVATLDALGAQLGQELPRPVRLSRRPPVRAASF